MLFNKLAQSDNNYLFFLQGQPVHLFNIDMFHDSLELSSLQVLQLCCYIKQNITTLKTPIFLILPNDPQWRVTESCKIAPLLAPNLVFPYHQPRKIFLDLSSYQTL